MIEYWYDENRYDIKWWHCLILLILLPIFILLFFIYKITKWCGVFDDDNFNDNNNEERD